MKSTDHARIFYYIISSTIEMREGPYLQSKVVSQGIFSERVLVLEIKGGWSFVSTPDDYTGWILSHTYIKRETPYQSHLKTSRLASHLYELKDIEYGPLQTLPYGSCLENLDDSDPRWVKAALPNGKEAYIQKGDVAPQINLKTKFDLPLFSRQFLGLPYTWGGRSSFGYDCSGFIQMLYQTIGIYLKRDSHQQAADIRFQTIDFDSIEPGDLIFFGNANHEIKHVAMYCKNNTFIHASSKENQPWIRMSRLSDSDWMGDKIAAYPYRIARQMTH